MNDAPKYEAIAELNREQIEAAIGRNEPNELLRAVLSAALYLDDWEVAQEICIKLATHDHFNVRGNAFLGFAHIARIHGKLDERSVRPLITNGLKDPDEYVRGHAVDAADDIYHFLGWEF